MKRSNITTLSLPWNQIGSTLPNLAQFIRLSLQKLRLEYKDKEAMPAIWHELGKKIGRRGCLQVDGLFEMGCGANPSTRINSAKHPTEAAKLKEFYAAPTAMNQQAAANGWIEEQIVPNLTLSVTGIPSPVEPSQEEVKAMITRVPDTKQRCQISATAFKTEMPACFRFSHLRRQEKAIERKLDFVRDQALAELRDFRENGAATDFLIELPNGERWAIESRADIHRNLAQNFGFAFLVLERLDPNRVLMVTPFTANVSRPKDMPTEIELSDLNNFSILLHETGAGKTVKNKLKLKEMTKTT